MNRDLHHVRQHYGFGQLDEAGAGGDPFALFARWLDEAVSAKLYEPTAMALATTTPDGSPSLRMVLLKHFSREGFVFYTNLESRKGKELRANSRVALLFWWDALERQVRIEGKVTPVATAEADRYFAARPRASQLAAAASPQSRVVLDRKELEQRVEIVESRFRERAIPRPDNWGGCRVGPESFEFWQGRESRLHDRLRFTLCGVEAWQRERLAP